ncbi:trypsin-like serine peptidase [Granulicella arctica]|uniref:trypsin-like serine peptidase n=1 Tax=Granulicella arctica TaxID=940613 RepID=UPI0021E0C974|nr:trypsin-like serine protease [Granulicella arctica]
MANLSENKVTGAGITAQEHAHAQAVEEYWTEERRANATPVPMPKEPGSAHKAHEVPQHGEAGHTEPGHPDGEKHAHTAQPHIVPGGNPVVNPLLHPYRTCGKVFFTQGGSNFAGSAAMISPNILLTAGHCVYNGGWSTNFIFYPSYGKRAANDPAYKFTYNYLASWTAWSQHGNRAYDYGMVWMPSTPGNLISWLGLYWNAPTANRTWRAVGYPATPNPPFNGNTMDEAVGHFASSGVAGTQGLTNDNMEHGSSGGPWITDFNGAAVYANGLQSTHVHDGDFTEYGPTFTAETKGLFDWINNPANRK